MHIKEIVLDGFKSYARRTVVDGFDPHFNAITGLNGSGKSNILDAICFVLGITNLSQVRAGNLTELVYKQGQAGINKASVSIVFDNSDESTSPVGYEECNEVSVTRQVIVGGHSKYLINGRKANANQVGNLFQSVQLNVNNPHFLIMQGHITKVVNMKPDEILGLVEEAAGTRLYESKRVAALKTIEKKQMKVDEINAVLAENITPTLERLRKEKQDYLKWSKNNADIERNQRFVVASDFFAAQETVSNSEERKSSLLEKSEELDRSGQTHREQISSTEGEIEILSSRLNAEFEETHCRAKELEEKMSKQLVKATSAWNNSQSVLASARDDLSTSASLAAETKRAFLSKQDEANTEETKIEKLRLSTVEAQHKLANLTHEYQSMCAGVGTSENDATTTLPDQISQAYADANAAESCAEQATLKIEHLRKEIPEAERALGREESKTSRLSVQRKICERKVLEAKDRLSRLDFSPDKFNALCTEKNDLDAKAWPLKQTIETLSARLEARLAFDYSDPVRGFDRSKVKGILASLITVRNAKHATALEVVAGGKLYQIVVDDVVTGKALLTRGKLQKRVTIIPLDKITSRRVSDATAAEAAKIANKTNSSSSPALDLIYFDEEVRNAVEYVFGGALIVDGPDAANRICEETRTRTVTLEGDVYDPSGTISGGSSDSLGTTLANLEELTKAKTDQEAIQNRLTRVSDELERMRPLSDSYADQSSQLELAQAELDSVEQHIALTEFGRLSERLESMREDLEKASAQLELAQEKQRAKWALHNELKEKEQELTDEREKRLKTIDNRLKAAKIEAGNKLKEAEEAENMIQSLRLELESMKADYMAAEEAVSVAEKAEKETAVEEAQCKKKAAEIGVQYENSKAALDEIEHKIASCSSEIRSLSKAKAKYTKLAEEAELEKKKVQIEVDKVQKETQAAEKLIASMLKKHPWIETEKESFGRPGGDYDFGKVEASRMKNKLRDLSEEQAALSKKINKKVMGMIEKAESEYTELLRKRKIVENDKRKIQDVIEELDVKKKSELALTWEKVNKDFGLIFSTLLSGASAKLEPPEGLQVWEGLEVKVAFGEIWKKSLSELSGGQRSLLALSLILALLLFKPAPMYILDEVDAALDLSHTQNIGNMLKKHFSQSQFIVVSLKEGMFNNANVIFRTKFIDGVSTVTRTLGSGISAENRNDETEQLLATRTKSTRSSEFGKENELVH